MRTLAPWIERRWSFTLPVGSFLEVVDRLAGMPIRGGALVAGVPETVLAARPGSSWSAKEHLGHLSDLHTLDAQRLREFLAGVAVLSSADPLNQRTVEANHRATPIAQLLKTVTENRRRLVHELADVSDADIARTARHPRLGLPMRLIDWAQFMADHDDHHLAAARLAIRAVAGRQERG
jgi:DinB family protein